MRPETYGFVFVIFLCLFVLSLIISTTPFIAHFKGKISEPTWKELHRYLKKSKRKV